MAKEWVITPVRGSQEGDVLAYFSDADRGRDDVMGSVVSVDVDAQMVTVKRVTGELVEMPFKDANKRALHFKRARREHEVFDWERDLELVHRDHYKGRVHTCSTCAIVAAAG